MQIPHISEIFPVLQLFFSVESRNTFLTFFFSISHYSNPPQRTHGFCNIRSSKAGFSTLALLTFSLRLLVGDKGFVLVENL